LFLSIEIRGRSYDIYLNSTQSKLEEERIPAGSLRRRIGRSIELAVKMEHSQAASTPMANVNKNVNNGRNRGKGEAVEIALESTVRRGNRGSWNDGVNWVAHCGACKFLGRKCTSACLFAPYFSSDGVGEARFGEVHKIFGAANFSKLLLKIEPERRQEAVQSICFEAQCRILDPVNGCVPIVHEMEKQLQRQVSCTSLCMGPLRIFSFQLGFSNFQLGFNNLGSFYVFR
jgi:hypothetical protein